MRHYHVLVEFSEPIGHARAFAHVSETQVRHHFILPWTRGNLPIGPDRDVIAAQVARLRIFRAARPEDLGSANRANAKGLGHDVTDLFLSEIGARAGSPPQPRRARWFGVGAAALALLAIFRSRPGAARRRQPA